jgi:nitrite reductase/ring-hydroxylating ferredoxin subunit
MATQEETNLGNERDLPAGEMKVVKARGREILLIRTGTGVYALDNFCIHNGCRLEHGRLDGERLRCPCHSSVFDVKTGEVVDGPATRPQPVYTVTLRNSEIFLSL